MCHRRDSPFQIAIGLHSARLGEASGDKLLAFAIGDPASQAPRRGILRLEPEHFLDRGVGAVAVEIRQPPGLLEK